MILQGERVICCVSRMSGRQGGRGGGRGRGKVITDPRFARVHTDARFQVFPSKQRTVEIDERFEGMHTSLVLGCVPVHDAISRLMGTFFFLAALRPALAYAGLFKDKEFQVRAPVDKRGRKVCSFQLSSNSSSCTCVVTKPKQTRRLSGGAGPQCPQE